MRPGPVLLLLCILLVAPPVPAQQEAPPSVWVHLAPETLLREPGQERSSVRVEVSVGCVLPSALAPGWRIDHEVQVRPEGAVTAQLDRTSWEGNLPASSCADQGAGAEYTLTVDLRFNDRVVRPQVVDIVVWANVTLPGHPSYATTWGETVGSAGEVEIVRYDTVRRAGDTQRFEFAVLNRGQHPVTATSRITTPPELGTAYLDAPTARVEDIIHYGVHYTPQQNGHDRFEVRVQVTEPGRLLAEETLVFEVENTDGRSLPAASAEGDRIMAPLLGLVALAIVALLFLARRPKDGTEADDDASPLKNP